MPVQVNDGGLDFQASIRMDNFEASIRQIESQLRGLTKTANDEATAVEQFAKRASAAITAYFSLTAGFNFIQQIVQVRGEFQQLEVAFTTMLQSKEKADKLMEQVTNFAATTPFELSEVANATKQLLAFGIEAEDIEGTLRSLGDVAAGLGQPLGEIAYLYGTIKTQGVAMTIDVRQFAQRGIPIYKELAKVLGVAEEQVGDLITAGKVGFPEIEKVFQSLTAEGSRFGGLMAEQSKTLTGQISNLHDAFERMLNDIGRSGEGAFADIIQAAEYLVSNYREVIKILEVLIITYGSYRAALIATNVVQSISTSLTKGWTVAETLRYQAMLISERAAKILNATLLKNPAAFVVAGIAAMISAFTLFSRKVSEVKTKSELLSEANKKIADSYAEQEAKLRPYIDQLKNVNLTQDELLKIYTKLKEIDPKIVEGIDSKTLSYQSLTASVNNYVGALRNQIKLEANKEAITLSIKQEQAIQEKIDKVRADGQKRAKQSRDEALKAEQSESASFRSRAENMKKSAGQIEKYTEESLVPLTKQLEEQKKITQSLGEEIVKTGKKEQDVHVRNLGDIDADIKALKDKQSKLSTTRAEYELLEKQIKKLEDEKRKITGETEKPDKGAAATENKANALLEKRKSLLEDIAELQKQSQASGQSKVVSELQKINDRYDAAIKNIADYNKKVDEFNKKYPKNQVAKIGNLDIDKLNAARARELSNETLKEDAKKYAENLEKKKAIFEQYQDAIKDVGQAKADEMYGAEVKQYKDFLQLLEDQADLLRPKIFFNIANVGEQEKFKALIDQIRAYKEKKAKEDLELEKRNFIDLLQASTTYEQRKAEINQKYNKLEATLSKNNTIKDAEERKKILENGRKEELEALDNDTIRQSDLYKRLNQDILGFTRERIKAEIKWFEEKLKIDTTLTPQQKADIQGTIDQYKGLLEQTNDIVQDYAKIAQAFGEASNVFSELGSSIAEFNQGIAESIQLLGSLTEIVSDVAKSIASFAAGDIAGGITAGVSAITKLIGAFGRAKRSKIDAQKDILAFQQKVIEGEQAYAELIRERQRQEVKYNKTKLQGLIDEKRLLEEQKRQVLASYNEIFAQLQNESFITALGTKKKGGLFGILSQTETKQQLASLAGKSFEEIEKLFNSGQLTDKAKALFEQLQKLKQEGLDIDDILVQNAIAFKEALTGTTASNIVDSIAQGFAEGKKSLADFAGTFEDMMRNALIQSLKMKYLEPALNQFFEDFADAADSNGELTNQEIQNLNQAFADIISNANTQFQQLQQIAGLNVAGASAAGNSLSGAIKNITEQTAELIAGQLGGIRLTAIEHLSVGRNSLTSLQQIQINTGLTAARMSELMTKLQNWYEVRGVKIV